MLKIKLDNWQFFQFLKPKISWYPTVVNVDHTVAPLPFVKLTGINIKPPNKFVYQNSSSIGPVLYKIHNAISNIMRHPAKGQISPDFFLDWHVPPSTQKEPHSSWQVSLLTQLLFSKVWWFWSPYSFEKQDSLFQKSLSAIDKRLKDASRIVHSQKESTPFGGCL